jgi:hypothetical protein
VRSSQELDRSDGWPEGLGTRVWSSENSTGVLISVEGIKLDKAGLARWGCLVDYARPASPKSTESLVQNMMAGLTRRAKGETAHRTGRMVSRGRMSRAG